ncbi:MAG: hypothetical protein WC238_04700 [Parcubacteria group bacterium]|jgi:hypothetical protein
MRYREFIGVFVTHEDDPITGEPNEKDLPATVNLDAIEAFNDAGDGCTCVRMDIGADLLLRITYKEFKELFFYSVTPAN